MKKKKPVKKAAKKTVRAAAKKKTPARAGRAASLHAQVPFQRAMPLRRPKAPRRQPWGKPPQRFPPVAQSPGRGAAKRTAPAFTKRDLEEIKLKLDAMRESLSKNVEDKKTLDMLEPEVGDTIDQATQSLDKEILFELSDNERKMLDNIDASLRKMDNGIYGLCEHCKTPIEKKRLKALPSARYCLPCQSGSEKTGR